MKTFLTTILALMVFKACAIDQTFSYQGELVDAGVAANGSYDIAIQAFDAVSFGNTVGAVSMHNGVNVSNGIFTIADVDLGANTFDGLDIWLQISVKRTADTNYTPLSPLQKLRSVPYATTLIDKGATDGQVLTFDAANGWQPASLASSTDNQNIQNLALSGTSLTVGIENGNSQSVDLLSLQDGTGTDTQNLSLSGTTLSITNGSSASFSGWDTNASDDFSGNYNDLSNKPWAFDGLNTSRTSGFTGIGTSNPAANLHIKMTSANNNSGGIRLQTASSTTGEDWYIRMPASDDLVFTNDSLDVFTIKKNTGDIEMAGELHSAVSGDADMKAYIYGHIYSNLSSMSIVNEDSTSGFSLQKIADGYYNINFDDATLSSYSVSVTATAKTISFFGGTSVVVSPTFISVIQSTGVFQVRTFDSNGDYVSSSFNFIVYKK